MQKTILQITMDKQLKINAEKAAFEQGFSSLQEVVRVFLTQLASRNVQITLQESLSLSVENEKRYIEMTKDFEVGINVFFANDVQDLVSKS